MNLWSKSDILIPAPLLVCVELNPGPSKAETRRSNVLFLKQKMKLSNRQIAAELAIERKTVQRIINKFGKKKTLKNAPGQGRKRKIPPGKPSKSLKNKAKKGKVATEIARQLRKTLPGGISDRTVQRSIKRTGLRYLVRQKTERITESQAERRLRFAKQMKNYDWKFALFTDEKTFQVGTTPHKSWQDPDEREEVEVKRHAAKIHVWGGIGLHFKTKLYFFTQTLDGVLYRKILKARLPPDYFGLPPKQSSKWIFVQDNDPKHTAYETTELLDQIAPDRLQGYPANSPDLNIIEDAWSTLAEKLEHKNITTLKALKANLQKEWKNLDMQKIRNSIESIPRRLAQVIERGGKRTSY